MDNKEDILPESYRCQKGCYNCIHVFRTFDHDSSDNLYCTLNAPSRPKCGSHAMGPEEDNNFAPNEPGNPYPGRYAWEVWDEWSKGRYVDDYGICDNHKSQPPKSYKPEHCNGHQYLWCHHWRITPGTNPRCLVKCSEYQREACRKQQIIDKENVEKLRIKE